MTEDNTSTPAADLSLAMMEMIGLLEPMIEAIEGYRQNKLSNGYSKEEAASMARDMHNMLFANMVEAIKNPTPKV
jgi:hypothetical protein